MPTLIHLQITPPCLKERHLSLCSFCSGFTSAPKQSAQQRMSHLGRKHLGFPEQGFGISSLSWVIVVDAQTTPHPTDLLLCWFLPRSPLPEPCLWSHTFCPLPFCTHLSLISWFSEDFISKASFLEFFKTQLQFLAIIFFPFSPKNMLSISICFGQQCVPAR